MKGDYLHIFYAVHLANFFMIIFSKVAFVANKLVFSMNIY